MSQKTCRLVVRPKPGLVFGTGIAFRSSDLIVRVACPLDSRIISVKGAVLSLGKQFNAEKTNTAVRFIPIVR